MKLGNKNIDELVDMVIGGMSEGCNCSKHKTEESSGGSKSFMESLMDTLEPAIKQHGGELIKITGDKMPNNIKKYIKKLKKSQSQASEKEEPSPDFLNFLKSIGITTKDGNIIKESKSPNKDIHDSVKRENVRPATSAKYSNLLDNIGAIIEDLETLSKEEFTKKHGEIFRIVGLLGFTTVCKLIGNKPPR